jgi:hypothetical protein
MRSNHQTTNLVFPYFLPTFFSVCAIEKENYLSVQNSFSSQFASSKQNHDKYSLKKIVDSEFVV